MNFLTIILPIAGFFAGVATVLLFSTLRLKHLRTVPKPPELKPDAFKMFSAEARAGVRLQQACYNNDAEAASEALTMWAWASGESAMANNLDQKMDALNQPDFREAVTDLWSHLEATNNKQWFGDLLWRAFLKTNPEFQELEFIV